ncbi:hypothetical protein GQ457_09G018830 [Hibiscus cannabinus]
MKLGVATGHFGRSDTIKNQRFILKSNRIYPNPNVLGLKSGSKPTNGVGLLPVGLAPGMDHSWGWDLLGRVDRIRVHEPNRSQQWPPPPLFLCRRPPPIAVVRRVSGHARIPTEASWPPLSLPQISFPRKCLEFHENGPNPSASSPPISMFNRWIGVIPWYVVLSHANYDLNGGDHRWNLR